MYLRLSNDDTLLVSWMPPEGVQGTLMPTIAERLEVLDGMFARERRIMESKANDYSGAADCNKNIMACEVAGLCAAEVGLLVRLGDKFQRLISLLGAKNKPQVEESLSDTISDMRNYLCILEHVLLEKAKNGDSGDQAKQ